MLSGPGLAATPPQASDAETFERATALRREATELRARAARQEALRKPECDRAFQVNRCLQEAREARLVEVNKARDLEHRAHQLELGVKRRQANGARVTEPARSGEAKPPAPPLHIRMRDGQAKSPRPADAAERRQAHEARHVAVRHKEEAAAARRAAQARADQARYDARQRAWEEKQKR